VLKQPGQFAWQVFDSKVSKLLRPNTGSSSLTKVSANTLEDLAPKLEGVNPDNFLKTVREYNAAVRKTCRSTTRSRTASARSASSRRNRTGRNRSTLRIRCLRDQCGITFTFGGCESTANRPGAQRALPQDPRPLLRGRDGGRLFYFNYPSGTGLVSGAVFGRIAGRGAALAASKNLAAN